MHVNENGEMTMTIRDPKRLQTIAAHRVENAPGQKKILLIYCGITLGICLMSALAQALLGLQMEDAGGLKNMGLRTILSTVGTVLPIVANVVMMGLNLGLTAVMLRIARQQYVSPMTLKAGVERFWPLIRWILLQAAVYFLLGIVAMNVSTMVYIMSPLSNGLVKLLEPMLTGSNPQNVVLAMTEDPEMMASFLSASWPVYALMLLLAFALVIPMSYRLRLGNYVLLDEPRAGAFRAFGRSRELMKNNCMAMFRLDLRLWWYHAAMALAMVLNYGTEILTVLGVALPGPFQAWVYLFYGASLLAQVALYYFLYSRVGVTYALAYESLLPREQPDQGVVLGNIFQM